MARSFTLCLIVTLMVFAGIRAFPEQNQDRQKVQSRGAARYYSTLTSESSDFVAQTTRSPRNKSFRANTASNLEKNETHFARESSSRSRSKLSRTDGSASWTNARNLNSSAYNSRNRSTTPQVFKEDSSRHGDNKENVPESQVPKQQTASRRTSSDASSVWVDSTKLDHDVFTKSPEYSRSRTGRKIYNTSNNGKESRSQIVPSRKSVSNENLEKDRRLISKWDKEEARLVRSRLENITSIANTSREIDTKSSSKKEVIRERDVLPLNSESVLRIDVPLIISENGHKDANIPTSTTISFVNVSPRQTLRLIKESNDIAESSTRKSKQSGRSESHDASNANNNPETINSESISLRNSSRSIDTANVGTNRRSPNVRRRFNAKNGIYSRNQSAHKSKDTNATETRVNGRQKKVDVNLETNANAGQTNLSSNNERTFEGKRRPKNDRKLKVTEAKIDEQNAQAQSRSWSRTSISNLDIITTTIPKVTIAEATSTISSLDTEIATLSSTTIKSSTVARISPSTKQTSQSKERNRNEDSRVKKLPKEDFFNHGLGFRGRKAASEGSSSTIADLKITTSKSETQSRGNPGWTLKRRPNYASHDITSTTSTSVDRNNQTNEIILPNDPSMITKAPLSEVLRRGTKRPKVKDESNTVSSVAPKNVTRGSKTFNKSERIGSSKETEVKESDNYPLAFRARLSQSKNSNLKLTGAKSTTRTSLQATKSIPASLFSERSKQKLDLARKLIKPELNIDENNLDKTTSVPYSDKFQVKETSTVSEDKNVEKITKTKSIILRDREKILEVRKFPKDRNFEGLFRSSTNKKSLSIISSSVEGTLMSNVTENTINALDENNNTTIKPLKLDETPMEVIKSDKLNNDEMQRKTADTFVESLNIHTTEFAHEITLPPTITTSNSMHSSMTESKKLYPVYIPKSAKEYNSSEDRTKIMNKTVFQPRYTKQQKPENKMTISTVTSMTVGPTSRYVRKKSGTSASYSAKPFSTEATFTQMKHREFRPRTATYRRHSEVSTSQSMIQQSTKGKETTADSVTTTSRSIEYQIITSKSFSEPSKPLVSVKINTSNNSKPLVFTESNKHNSSSNIFNPTKSAFLSKNTSTLLLEQLRSTVAPLLNTLNERTPIFSGSYSNVNIGNSAPRITPNGSPPRFSARYKGAELFVRKPSTDQVLIPSITTSSTTASTLIENSELAPPVNSPEPRFITFYQALESASIKNENLGVNDVSQRHKLTAGVMKVDSNTSVIPNGTSNDTANNNDTTSSISASIVTASFPDFTITTNITTTVQLANLSDTITFPPTTENVIVTQISPEATTMSMMNDVSENMETNTVQQYDEAMSQTTETKDVVENIEMNTIQQFDGTASQMIETISTTESIMTEEISNDISEMQVTQVPVVTSMFHTRLINIAQNILPDLQENFSTARTSIQNPTTATSPKPFNEVSNSSSINIKNSEETTTMSETSETTITQNVNTDSTQTTINRPAQEMSAQSVISSEAFSIAYNRSNDQETNVQNMLSLNITQNARNSSTDAEVTSSFVDFIMKNDSRPSNDTLLSRLMILAKTLFSEEINESLIMPDQLYETIVSDISNLTQAMSMMEDDDKSQFVLSNNNTLEKPNASANLSIALENTSERMDATTFGNKTEESPNRESTVGPEISLMEFNTRSTDIENLIDDTTTTIAQGTAIGSRIIQPEQSTETINSILTTSSESLDSTTILSSIEPTTDTATTTSTMTTTTLQTTSTNLSSRANLATTVGSTLETTIPAIDINENLISTETTIIDTRGTTIASTELEELTTTIVSPVTRTTTTSPTTQVTGSNQIPSRPPTSFSIPNKRPYLGFSGGNQATRVGSSSKAPVRDYQIYGIYPNKTIVRKRPEDNLIDARNINSPYVIFGIFPDGRLVRKFPNGTIIPDSPRSPVESNILLNTQKSTSNVVQSPIGTSIIPDRESSEASGTKVTSDQRTSVYIGQDKFINYQINGPEVNPKVVDVKINSVATSMSENVASSNNKTSIPSFENLLNNQLGGRVTSSPSSPWKDPLDQIFGITTNSPTQTSSVASNQLNKTTENKVPIMARPVNSLVEVFTPVTSSVTPTSFENKLLSNSTTVSITTTAPVITTIPVLTTIRTTTPATTTTTIATTTTTAAATTTTTASTTTTTTPSTTTTIVSTTTTPTTTTTSQTTNNVSTVPRIATTASSISANTLSDVTIRSNTVPPSPTSTISVDNILNGLQTNTKENPFGTTFEDLTFLNSLLQNNNVKTTSKTLNDVEQMLANRILELALAKPGLTRASKAIKTANSNKNVNAIKDFPSIESSSESIIIDLLASSSTSLPSTSRTTKKYNEAKTTTLVQSSTSAPTTTTKKPAVITKPKPKPTMRLRTTTTTQASVGFGANLWRWFGSNRFEATTTVASTQKKPKPTTPRLVQTTKKSFVEITQRPVQSVRSTTHSSHIMSAIRSPTTSRSVDISDIQVITTKSSTSRVESTSVSPLDQSSTQQTLLNNPNPRLNDIHTSTYSSEDDERFLVALLRAIQTETKTSTSTTPKITEDDEAFLRAILNNQASISTTTSSSTESNPAALLALLLKQQGIEPSTPVIKVREQLQSANLDSTTARSTITTNRPVFSSSTKSTIGTRIKTTTSRQSSRPFFRPSGSTWSPSSTYPPPLFGENSGSGLFTATRAIGQFLGSAITGAAQQFQSFLRNRRQ